MLSLFCLSRNPGCLLVWRRSLPHPRRSWQGKNRLRYDVLPTQGRVPDPVSQNSSLFALSPPVLVNRWTAQNLHTGTSPIVSRGNTKIFIKIFNAAFHLASFFHILTLNSYKCYPTKLCMWLIAFCHFGTNIWLLTNSS